MHRTRGRLLTLLAIAAAAGAAYLAVHSGLNAGATGKTAKTGGTKPHTTSFGPSTVRVTGHASGVVCYRVIEPSGSAHGCRRPLKASEIAYTISPHAIGGLAGENVAAVILKLTRRGTKWATIRDGVFYADVPIPYRVRAVIKVLRGGTRETFAVKPTH